MPGRSSAKPTMGHTANERYDIPQFNPLTPNRILASMSLSSLVQEMAWHQVGANPFLEPMLTLHRDEAKEQSQVKYLSNVLYFIEEN